MCRTAWTAGIVVGYLIACGGSVQAQPIIGVSPAAVSSTQPADTVVQQMLTITNTGSSPLSWEIREAPSDCDQVADIPWLSTSPITGTTSVMSPVDVTFDSTGLGPGIYRALLCVESDDPNRPRVVVPATLTIPSLVPTLSAMGLAAFALIALAIAFASFRRRRHAA